MYVRFKSTVVVVSSNGQQITVSNQNQQTVLSATPYLTPDANIVPTATPEGVTVTPEGMAIDIDNYQEEKNNDDLIDANHMLTLHSFRPPSQLMGAPPIQQFGSYDPEVELSTTYGRETEGGLGTSYRL